MKRSHNFHHDHRHTGEVHTKNIWIAVLLNFGFAISEFIVGYFSNSVALYSDGIHDLGDSIILLMYALLERFSGKGATDKYTYGYRRYSLLGSIINMVVLFVGSLLILRHAIPRLFNPEPVVGQAMFIMAILGIVINGFVAYKIRRDDQANQDSLFLHILSDAILWVGLLISSLFIIFLDIYVLDTIFSILVALWLLFAVAKSFIPVLNQLMQAAPSDIDVKEIKKIIYDFNDLIIDVHDLHIWNLDNVDYITSVHIVFDDNINVEEMIKIKEDLKIHLEKYDLNHTTIEVDVLSYSIKED